MVGQGPMGVSVKVSGGSELANDHLDVPLEDAELLAEVELTTNLIIAASEADAFLPQAEVDRLLGLESGGEKGQVVSIPHQISRTTG